MRELKYSEAIREATDQCLANDPKVYLIGLGVPDPKGIFGTTLGLSKKYGDRRVMDMPTSENGMTGIIIGSAIAGMRPIITHQRVDFTLLAFDQIINNAAKWHYMFGGQTRVPIVIRIIIGRGWGQGPQHSQSLQSIFSHIPGLKVVMPTTPYDAKGMFISAVEDNSPVIFLEHRWLHGTFGHVPEKMYRVPIGKARIAREGRDVSIISTSLMTVESLRAADILSKEGIEAEVIDVRSLQPFDWPTLLNSIKKTGRLVVAEGDWKTLCFGTEIITRAAEEALSFLKAAPQRVAFPDIPTPTSWALSNHFYPRAIDIINAARRTMGLSNKTEQELGIKLPLHLDIPDPSFLGPF